MNPRPAHGARLKLTVLAALAGVAMTLPGAATRAADAPKDPAVPVDVARREGLPRKVLLGTVVCGPAFFALPLEARLARMDETVDRIAAQAASEYPGKRLDLVVLPEAYLERPGDTVSAQAVKLADIRDRIGACALRHGCYLVVPAILAESAPSRYSNTALLVDRSGSVAGIYRKVHPVAPQGSDDIETGTTPGGSFPVFDCDFGRLGIQICFDMLYPDGWAALARQGAEIVALPSASPQTTYPSVYALEHRYYVVSAVPRDHAAVYSPVGIIEKEATQEGTMVDEIDLSYALLHWEAVLEEGQAFRRAFGDRAGFHYYRDQDTGIFWSNDPGMPIARMTAKLGLVEVDANADRVRALQDKARGGPPVLP
jgi:predicted amidohydrolase